MIKVTTETVRSAERAAAALDRFNGRQVETIQAMALAIDLRRALGLTRRVLDQATRRIIKGESVPSQDEVVSIFEPHTDIIRKGHRDTHYGHKLYLSSGPSGLATDCRVLDGNPADATLTSEAVERHRDVFGTLPRHVAFDGGFASRAHLETVKEHGVEEVAFAKGRGVRGVRDGQEQLGLPDFATSVLESKRASRF